MIWTIHRLIRTLECRLQIHIFLLTGAYIKTFEDILGKLILFSVLYLIYTVHFYVTNKTNILL